MNHSSAPMCPSPHAEPTTASSTVCCQLIEPNEKPPSATDDVTTADGFVDLESGGGGCGTVHIQAEASGNCKHDNNDSYLPRLVLRNRPFGQSNNKVHIQHNQGLRIYSLLKFSWFHALLRWPTSRSMGMLMSTWTGAILFFAGLYVWHDNLDTAISCGLGKVNEPMKFAAAFAFSLETCTTVGYGLPNGVNSFFEVGCGSLQLLIYLQMAWSMIFNAFLLAFLYARLGRSETRSNQVINSQKALVSCVDGQVRFQVRLFDADAEHPVVEAHVRMYCVMNHRPVPRPLRLLQPDDDMGGMLFLSFPTVVSHHLDLYSMLHPPTAAPYSTSPSGLVLRQVDGTTAARDDIICPVCGESYGSIGRWKNHVRYQQIVEAKEDYPTAGTHLSLDMDVIEQQAGLKPTNDLDELKEYFRKNVSEVICVLEGIDPIGSGTFQSLQSYRFEDIVWEAQSQFAPCLTVVEGPQQKKKGERIFQVDLERYHDIQPDTQQIQQLQQQQEVEEEVRQALMLSETSSTVSSITPPTAAATTAEATAEATKRRHRRLKTVSSRASDCLFVTDTRMIDEPPP